MGIQWYSINKRRCNNCFNLLLLKQYVVKVGGSEYIDKSFSLYMLAQFNSKKRKTDTHSLTLTL